MLGIAGDIIAHPKLGACHPSFAVQPSGPDVAAMRGIVNDTRFAGSFAVLMIVRLDAETLTAGAWVFDPQGAEHPVTLEVES